MSKLSMVIVLVLGLSACHASFGVGDSGQQPSYVASSALGSVIAQASMAAQPVADWPIVASRTRGPDMIGTVKRWFADRGFGFVRPSDGSPDVFVHASAFKSAGLPDPRERVWDRGTRRPVACGQRAAAELMARDNTLSLIVRGSARARTRCRRRILHRRILAAVTWASAIGFVSELIRHTASYGWAAPAPETANAGAW
jgi:cold shock CspA family protein